ncbi:hypothetical protein BGP75_12640 [Motiliproteus sp. MSK22-1]|nr:hypothetical protein BGP75_12640 [Motiliproteus sp. MSK22-1]
MKSSFRTTSTMIISFLIFFILFAIATYLVFVFFFPTSSPELALNIMFVGGLIIALLGSMGLYFHKIRKH